MFSPLLNKETRTFNGGIVGIRWEWSSPCSKTHSCLSVRTICCEESMDSKEGVWRKWSLWKPLEIELTKRDTSSSNFSPSPPLWPRIQLYHIFPSAKQWSPVAWCLCSEVGPPEETHKNNCGIRAMKGHAPGMTLSKLVRDLYKEDKKQSKALWCNQAWDRRHVFLVTQGIG